MPTRVVVMGGGVAGMSAAHELVERGFEVVVLERGDLAGGKARSIPVVDDGEDTSGHQLASGAVGPIEHRLPGEHGFRFFPGFYKHVIDTMRRTPSFDGRKAADHLAPTTRIGFTQYAKPMFVAPSVFPLTPGDAGAMLRAILLMFEPVTDLTPDDLAFFGARIWQILTSCPERRLGEYERTSWWDFVGAESRSGAYQKFLGAGITRSLVAAKARKASTRTIGDIFVQLVLSIITPTAVASDRVLDGPTNLVWIDPWLAYLQSRGVRYVKGARIEEILCHNGRIAGVAVSQEGKRTVATGDYYIAALPIEKIAPLVSADMLAADPRLKNLGALAANVEWMNGVQFYLHRNLPTAHGHVIHIDTEWALTSVSQLQFWHDVPPEFFKDSEVQSVLSVDVSDWTAPGSTGRAAIDCSREEVVRETWSQLKRSMNSGEELLREEDLHSWFLDPDITSNPALPARLTNGEPLLVNLVDTWALRPEAATGVPNLFLASDYVRTTTDLATMEGANEAARRAVNGVLDAAGFSGSRCELWPLHEPEILQPWRLHDAARYRAGLAWDDSLMQVAAHAMRGASPLLEQARPLIEQVAPFANAAVKALDRVDRVLPDVRELSAGDPHEVGRFVTAYAPESLAPRIVKPLSGAGDILGPAGFLERLTWYRDMLTDTLAEAIPSAEPQRHLYALVRDFVARSGKGLRPALCIATARALGGRAEDALPAAAGLEMLHNGFLVHDDIEDGSDWRRGVATMHRSAGIPIALNAGDSMNALAMRLFRKSGERLGPAGGMRIFAEVDHLVVETLEGQAMELGWVRDNDLTVTTDDYLRLVLKKTAWYSFIHPLRIGALIANGDDGNLDRFDRFGYLIGAAFQITDDVLNLKGDAARYGKEINGDLWEGKRTLLLTHAFGQSTAADQAWIRSFLARPRARRLPREVLRLHDIIEGAGSLEWARQAANAFAEAAAREFDGSAFPGTPASPDLDWLRASVDYLVRRDS
jgi:geranylgeranyl pyrophosphate synthase/uncharacterized protein with NAD-binding domain and iron-sulfur cluster